MTVAPDARRDRWDLFCRVVDNYGDVGIAWRLARQLAADPRRAVRLFVDGLSEFDRLEPRCATGGDRRMLDGVEVVRWPDDQAAFDDVGAVVVELLGCGLPAGYLDAMTRAASRRPCVWIDFEHLSAEPWVADFHGLPSPHPVRPLVKHFFYPGFGPRTGGLLLEPGLAERRAAFVCDPEAVASLWRRLGVPSPIDGERRLSLFAYDHAPVEALLEVLSQARDGRWSVVVPDGVADAAIARFFGTGDRATARVRGAATVLSVPFVDQPTYDRLLWACDVNFVRGEDSFVRAQAAGRPFVWNIYRQPEAAHLMKLAAFEALHEAALPVRMRAVQRAAWRGWNDAVPDCRPALRDWLSVKPALREHAERWRLRLGCEAPLIDRLLAFVAARRQPSPAADLLD